MFEATGLTPEIHVEPTSTELLITPALLNRWFAPATDTQPTYATHLGKVLSETEITKVHKGFNRLLNQTVKWEGAIAFVHAHR
ncbi:hypothetical protein [Kovacikia minuta]|uniref:hypothetical protein n=1 Tax=Kovacikia minuta TaxID=2931930 RepID=UPI0036F44BB4